MNASGAWSYTTATLANDNSTFTAIATDAAGNTSAASNAVDPVPSQFDDWKTAVSATWGTKSDWSSGVPVSADLVVLNARGTYTVTSAGNVTIAQLNTIGTATLAIAKNTFIITNGTGAGVLAGTISIANGATLEISGTFDNSGKLELNATSCRHPPDDRRQRRTVRHRHSDTVERNGQCDHFEWRSGNS